MYKKISLVILSVLIILYLVINHTVMFVYLCPYTYTDGFKYIAKPIKEITRAANMMEKSMKNNGLDVKVIFQNAYGSGFLKNNPIPNDLDYMLGIDLGEYTYDNNLNEIAKNIAEKINMVEPTFLLYLNNSKTIFSHKLYIELLSETKRDLIEKNIINYLDSAISGKNYVKVSKKIVEYDSKNIVIEIPYMMHPYEILLDDYKPIDFLAKDIRYYKNTPNYLRGLMFVFEYHFTVIKDGKKVDILLVPENYLGARLQLARRFYVSNTFVGFNSLNYIKKYHPVINDEEYFFYRMLTFRRHLQEIENIVVKKDRPVKLIKRIMQTADSIQPLLSEETYNEISDYVKNSLSDEKIILLNEIYNILGCIYEVLSKKYLADNVSQTQELKYFYDSYDLLLNELVKYNEHDLINLMQNYKNNYLKSFDDIEKINIENLKSDTSLLKVKVNEIADNLLDHKLINKYVLIFNKIRRDAGYHDVDAYWLNRDTLGFIKDDFTKSIKDFDKLAQENNLPKANFVYIKPNDIKILQTRHRIWARYNSTDAEKEGYIKLKNTLLEDKSNFKPKFKFVWFY